MVILGQRKTYPQALDKPDILLNQQSHIEVN